MQPQARFIRVLHPAVLAAPAALEQVRIPRALRLVEQEPLLVLTLVLRLAEQALLLVLEPPVRTPPQPASPPIPAAEPGEE